MKNKSVNVAIIGAGSGGISALRRVRQDTDDFVVIDGGPLGTTCARVGCMPSKVLLHVARDFHARKRFEHEGIAGSEALQCDVPAVMRHVRELRDRFAGGMVTATEGLAGDRLIRERARILGPGKVQAGDNIIEAKSIIIATGSSPNIPEKWRKYSDWMLTSDNIFEQTDLPERIGVIGIGAIGLELGQAFGRLGLQVSVFGRSDRIGGLSDAKVKQSAIESFGDEDFKLYIGSQIQIEESGQTLVLRSEKGSATVDKIIMAAGVSPNLKGLGLENLDVELDEKGVPAFDPFTGQVGGLPVYIAGDVNDCRPILHEALDEGFIAGHNAVSENSKSFCRRVPLRVVFSDPQIAVVGRSFKELDDFNFIVGSADFETQSRAIVEGVNHGLMHIYFESGDGRILGAEIAAPAAEHLGHILALALQQEMTVTDLLKMPFYHPTIEESLRTALRDAVRNLPDLSGDYELGICGSCPESILC